MFSTLPHGTPVTTLYDLLVTPRKFILVVKQFIAPVFIIHAYNYIYINSTYTSSHMLMYKYMYIKIDGPSLVDKPSITRAHYPNP